MWNKKKNWILWNIYQSLYLCSWLSTIILREKQVLMPNKGSGNNISFLSPGSKDPQIASVKMMF